MVLYHIHSCMSEKLYLFYKHISKVCLVRIQSHGYRNRRPIQRIRFLWFGLRETYNIDESVWYNYVYNIYAKWNLFIISLFKLLVNLLHQKIENNFWATFGFWGNFWATFRVLEQLLSNLMRKLEQHFEKIGATCGQPYGSDYQPDSLRVILDAIANTMTAKYP